MKYFILACLVLFCSCSEEENPLPLERAQYLKRVSVDQGVWGWVEFWEGDHMPSPDGVSGKKYAVERQILFCEPVQLSQISNGTSFYDILPSKLIKSTFSDGTGFFQLKLEAGTYSLFIKEGDTYYQGFTGLNGYVGETIVQPNSTTESQVKILYKAVF